MNAEIRAAADRIAQHARRTPVMRVNLGGFDIQLKLEHLQHTGSFKARGAFNNILSRDIPAAGVVAASGGNHGAAVAYSAVKMGYPARIFVPEIAGPVKIGLIRETGADCVVVPGAYSNALDAAKAYEAETGAVQLHAYDAPETLAGQGTLFCEWEEQGLDADTVIVAVGGGGLIGGALNWFEGRRKLVAVEPELAPTLNAAIGSGKPAQVSVGGIAANALGAGEIGGLPFRAVQEFGVTSVLVEDEAIAKAQKLLWSELRLLVEPAAAAGLAALISGRYEPQAGETLAVLLCGANLSRDIWAED